MAVVLQGRQTLAHPNGLLVGRRGVGGHGARCGFAGKEFSVADIQLSFPIEAAAARAGLDASRPRLMDFLERIHARPAYQRALERGGPYELMS